MADNQLRRRIKVIIIRSMKNLLFLLTFLICGSLLAETTPDFGIRDNSAQHLAFINAKITISPEMTIDSATLIIKDGLVVAVGKILDTPEGAFVIDLDGKSIYPGFIDPYTEYGMGSVGDLNKKSRGRSRTPVYEGNRKGAKAWNDALHAEKSWVNYFETDSDAAKKFLELGFTTVGSSKHDGVLRGRSFVASLGDGIPNEMVLLSDGLPVASFDKGSSNQQYPSSQMGTIALLRQTFLDADWYKSAYKAYSKNSEQEMPEFNSTIKALENYKTSTFIFATNAELEILRADIVAREFGFDIVHVGSGREYKRLNEIKALGRTLIIPLDYPKKPEVSTLEDELDVSLATLRHWERAPFNAATLENAGVKFALTTIGLKKKSSFIKNLRSAVKNGLTKKNALAALTTVPADILGVSNLTGTLEKGKLANFFVCDGDIFEEKVTIYSTWTSGQKTSFKTLNQTIFGGTYDLAILDLSLKLKLKGEPTSLKGSISLDSNSVDLKSVQVGIDKIHFSAKLDTLGIKGLSRFTGRIQDGNLLGRWVSVDYGELEWKATVATTEEEADDEDEENPEKEDTDISFVSRLTYPNIAFGTENFPAQEDVLVKNATIWTSEDEGILYNSDLLIQNGKITDVGPNLTADKNIRVIDASGKHVTPGIIDEHSHTAVGGNVNEGTHSSSAEVRIGDVINPDQSRIYYAIAGGTTMLRALHGSANPIGGQAQVLKLRWGMAPEEMKFKPAPPSIKFALGENVKQSNWGSEFTVRYPQTRMGVESFIRDRFLAAVDYSDEWTANSKLSRKAKESTVPPRRNLELDALVDILEGRMAITCHSYVQSEVLMLMRLAEEFGFSVRTFTHILEGYKVADEMAAHGAGASTFSDWWAYKFEVYDAIPYNTCILVEKGVLTAVNSDSGELGRRLNQEAAKSVMYCGMEPAEALKLVTINPAKMLESDQWVGSLKKGKDADFVIWDGDPLSIYSHAEQTWIDGRKFFDIETDKEMRVQIKEERANLIQKVLGANDNGKKKDDKKGNGKKPHGDNSMTNANKGELRGGTYETR